MNVGLSTELPAILDKILEETKAATPSGKYWYPLSLATYGREEILEALDSMCTFRTSMGEKTRDFERKFSSWQGCPESVMVNSGSSADLLLCLLLGNPRKPLLPPGAEILVPVVTWPTQIWSVMMAGFKVKLVDVDPETLNVDLEDLERSIGPETRALFLVHLMGNPCHMDRIGELGKKHDLLILEDCCEAMGASWEGRKVGNFGIGAAYSFFFSHHITCMEGGMVVASDAAMAEQLRLLRAHGWVRNVDPAGYGLENYPEIDPRYAFVNWGLNVRPTEVQASFGLRQLEKLDAFGERRMEMATRFNAFLAASPWLKTPRVEVKATPSWLALPIMVDEKAPFTRAELTAFLEDAGVETRPVVTGNVAKHPVAELFSEFNTRSFPGADAIHSRGLYLGLSPMQTGGAMDRLIETFDTFLKRF